MAPPAMLVKLHWFYNAVVNISMAHHSSIFPLPAPVELYSTEPLAPPLNVWIHRATKNFYFIRILPCT